MFIFKAFTQGFTSAFSLGWPTCGAVLNFDAKKNTKNNWIAVSNDLNKAIEKYQEEKNVKK